MNEKTHYPKWLTVFIVCAVIYVLFIVTLTLMDKIDTGSPWVILSYIVSGATNVLIYYYHRQAQKQIA
ncbi:hypothetical protein SAMN05444359_114126 [Neolewinella agarilytica]|uniref:Uncharacterized protein n=1 Tax=Neolewinella agarilytica TaxID=478744 RepID=A0A1H9IBE6_9BACT|nr:hypothetical protein SAMN05444359_114126 [Neolewinella agarilytica]